MATIISFINQKGGVGKTTSAINTASYLAELGKFVLLIDLDPQGNATSGLGIEVEELDATLYDALLDSTVSIEDVVVRTDVVGLSIVPATGDLAGANIDLVNIENREFKLKGILDSIRHDYDYIIIDSPPSLGILTINGLVASDKIIIPVQAEYYALEGLGQLLETIELIKDNLKPDLEIMGALVTMFDKRNRLARGVVNDMKKHFPYHVFDVIIPRTVRLAEAPGFGQAINVFDKFNKGARAYKALAREIIEMKSD